GSLRDSASLPSARLMRLLRPLPRLRGRDREGARNKIRAGHPLPHPPPQAGEGADRDRGEERRVMASPPAHSRGSGDPVLSFQSPLWVPPFPRAHGGLRGNERMEFF